MLIWRPVILKGAGALIKGIIFPDPGGRNEDCGVPTKRLIFSCKEWDSLF